MTAEDAQTPTSEPAQAPSKPNVLRRLYDWVLGWADSRYGLPALFVLALAESSFFPIPPDVLLIALGIAAPTRAFRFALWCTIGSVIGGVIGYYIGYAVWSSVEPMIIPRLFSADKFEHATNYYHEYGVAIVFAAGFSPIPYKVFTIAAGVAKINLPAFIATSVVGRGARFFLVAAVVRRYGDAARDFIDRYFNLVTLAFTALLVGAFLLIKVVL
ncbi:YqaA family protein [Pseudenhygromyxa sp. WMMC2535]|uniref:YqaA family protein n=1 Tax=Pseudenhygromyxa sp. WMMC2535 TaxID=2712867 RepID=UPI0031F788EE